jgi:DNA-directed RNA polymerase subunit M/transcription elongation factor TFIIS
MFCPNCNQPLHYVNADQQHVLHCGNCGASFFEENAVNRISLATAEKLYSDRQTDEISGAEKKCPHDQMVLKLIAESQAIPENVTLFRCDRCHGVFAYGEDLVKFKNAQNIKVSYFKTWNKPLASLATVLVLSLVLLLTVSIINTSSQPNIQTTQARELNNKVYFSISGRYLFIYFKTQTPFRSEIEFIDPATKETIRKTISRELNTLHQLTTGDLDVNKPYSYKIILTDVKGRTFESGIKPLEIKP